MEGKESQSLLEKEKHNFFLWKEKVCGKIPHLSSLTTHFLSDVSASLSFSERNSQQQQQQQQQQQSAPTHVGEIVPMMVEGRSGCGKSQWVRCLASSSLKPYFWVDGLRLLQTDDVDAVCLLHKALTNASSAALLHSFSFVILDNIDSICSIPARDGTLSGCTSLISDWIDASVSPLSKGERRRRENLREGEEIRNRGVIFLIGITNEKERIHPRLLLPSRFGSLLNYQFPSPGFLERQSLCKKYFQNIGVTPDDSFDGSLLDFYEDSSQELSKLTAGYSAADINGVFQTALKIAFRSHPIPSSDSREDNKVKVTMNDIRKAAIKSKPSALAEDSTFTQKESLEAQVVEPKERNVNQNEKKKLSHFESGLAAVCSLEDQLYMAVLYPLVKPNVFRRLKAIPPGGILISGPPGTGKTAIARSLCVAASQMGVNVVGIEGTSIREAVVGRSERNLQQLFCRARLAQPSILLIDHIEAVGGKRGREGEKHNSSSDRLLSCLLTEMDGISSIKTIHSYDKKEEEKEEEKVIFEREIDQLIRNRTIVIGLTSHFSSLDQALVRPGRFDVHLQTSLPDCSQRKEILDFHFRKTRLSEDVSSNFLTEMAQLSEGKSGADLAHLSREAAMEALREDIQATFVTKNHIRKAAKTEWNI